MHVLHNKLFVIVLVGWSVPAIANKLSESLSMEHTTQTLDDGDMGDDLEGMALHSALFVSFFGVDHAVASRHYAAWAIKLRLDLLWRVVLPALWANGVLNDPLIRIDANSPFCAG